MTAETEAEHIARVRLYWQETHTAYLHHVGTTFQAGLVKAGQIEMPPRESNLWLAQSAGIRPGSRVLDAGCGVCGPAIDIAQEIREIEIYAVTVSPEQVKTGRVFVQKAGLGDKIHNILADYHCLPFPSKSFDTIYFLESACYCYDRELLFHEAYRVLKPGGNLYVKDVFHKEGVLSAVERADLEVFDRNFANQTVAITVAAQAIEAAGFSEICSRDITSSISTEHALAAMFILHNGKLKATEFGKRHFRAYEALPTVFGEISATRPLGTAQKVD